ncbi:MAG TPA: hypothetical protein VG319_01755 [Polyangia bacterium]|nr:hypothetical protein [Polyangia bacterium]
MKIMTRARLVLTFCSLLAACASSPPPPAAPPPMAATDSGQPKMQAALQALEQARAETTAASPNKGGHREAALGFIQQAMDAVNAGIQYAATHPTEIGEAQGPAAPEPVDQAVPGAERQPHMWQAVVSLREARRQLREAKHDKGGHRVQAMVLIEQAIAQLREGITFANRHGRR